MWLAYGSWPQGIIHMETALCLWLYWWNHQSQIFFLSKVTGLWGFKGGKVTQLAGQLPTQPLAWGPFQKCHLQVGWHKWPSQMPRWGMCYQYQRVQQGAKLLFGRRQFKTIFPWPPVSGFEHCKSAHLISRNFYFVSMLQSIVLLMISLSPLPAEGSQSCCDWCFSFSRSQWSIIRMKPLGRVTCTKSQYKGKKQESLGVTGGVPCPWRWVRVQRIPHSPTALLASLPEMEDSTWHLADRERIQDIVFSTFICRSKTSMY